VGGVGIYRDDGAAHDDQKRNRSRAHASKQGPAQRQEEYRMTDTMLAGLYRLAKLSRIAVDGHIHTVVDLPTMEKFCHEHAGSIEYPPPGERGWAVTRIGSHRFAAWYPASEVKA
jgi:hypothetical protein